MPTDDTSHSRTDPADTLVWTAERIRALGPITDLATAATILKIGRGLAYQMARGGTFPVPTLRVGIRYRVPVAPILEVLHLTDPDLTTVPPRSVDHQQQPGAATVPGLPRTDATTGTT